MSLRSDALVLRASTANARADLAAIYTWRSWLGGWLLRVLAQVVFFALIGDLVGSRETTHYLVVGNSVALVMVEAMMVVASTAWERGAGTFPLLVAAPGRLELVFVGRSVQWLLDGTVCSVIAFFAIGSLFGVPLHYPGALLVIPVIALIGMSTYGLGLFVAALALKAVTIRNVASNVTYLGLMAITGVQVPLSFWPGWVQVVADGLPVTHGLAAVRLIVAAGPLGPALQQCLWEGVVGACWLAVAMVSFRRLAESGRRNGSLEFS